MEQSPTRKRSMEDSPAPSTSAMDPSKRLKPSEVGYDEDSLQSTGLAHEGEEDSATTSRRLLTARRYLASQSHSIIIPSYSTWFSLSSIHPIERRSLPEFFNGKNRSKVPAIYKDYRDFMVHTYRLQPQEYLTVTACRRNLSGDVCAVMRVHAFLEQWGLINYQIDADTRPSSLAPPFTGHFRILVDTPRGLAPLHPGTSASSTTTTTLKKDLVATTGGGAGGDTKLSDETAASLAAQAAAAEGGGEGEGGGMNITIHPCTTCGSTTSAVQYTSLAPSSTTSSGDSKKKITLCPPCYTEGRFPSTLHSGSFLKLSSSPYSHSNTGPEGWSSQETLLLLEGLEMYNDDWDAVASHVGTRSKEQCIAAFLRLPIEEPFLEQSVKETGALGYNRLPWSREDNPVLGVMALLAESVGTEVAARAAGKGVRELEDELRRVVKQEQEQKEGGGEKDGEKEKEGEKEDTSMDVDPTNPSTSDPTPSSTSTDKPSLALTSLITATTRAHLLALEEDSTLHTLVTTLISTQLQKLELKLSHFTSLESLLEVERRGVEKQRQELEEERVRVEEIKRNVVGLWERAKVNPAGIERAEVEGMLSMGGGGAQGAQRPVMVQQPGEAPGVGQAGFARLG
ncbi:SWIRM domain-domain-containing protein [Leucosporidium creatinivorum]|uniref:SWIRM domain-domain-containing protein n=1 Tax=Leucosporidium creatinivorum TaxID=106004 RepID=A0A1Y2EIZ5_9BASI|nr:SWIRM domain-domain-containing protein [Leucosporidium creatinivorum]